MSKEGGRWVFVSPAFSLEHGEITPPAPRWPDSAAPSASLWGSWNLPLICRTSKGLGRSKVTWLKVVNTK
jgi:hypothetical protein